MLWRLKCRLQRHSGAKSSSRTREDSSPMRIPRHWGQPFDGANIFHFARSAGLLADGTLSRSCSLCRIVPTSGLAVVDLTDPVLLRKTARRVYLLTVEVGDAA